MFLWVDCEMTGLDFAKDSILEIAVICTDFHLNEFFSGSWVIHKNNNELDSMNEFCLNLHKQSGLYDKCLISNYNYIEAEEQIFELLKKHSVRKNIYIAGNSVYNDLLFIKKDFPKIYDWLHYRIMDVSTFKIINNFSGKKEFIKKK